MPEDNSPPIFTPGNSRTGLSRLLEKWISPLDRLFNNVYSSKYNPLYQSGPLAVGLLLVVLITGVYLLFFYRLGAPYESVVRIQEQVWSGRWIRALHRYASDAALVAVFFHILRIIIQGKTWGPRTLAWISGVTLTLAMFLSAWTGYVMVWDEHGRWIATLGASILEKIPIFSGTISSGFSGVTPLATSFFFMNLFLHVAVPLGLIVILWVHTAKLARSRWFPIRPLLTWTVITLILLAIVWPAPLEKKADLFNLQGKVITDFFYGFWMPLAEKSPGWGGLMFWGALVGLAISAPFWLRPSRGRRPPASFNDPEVCIGCGQCKEDCPYDAITMIPRTEGTGSSTFAQVEPNLCVSCGICPASCSTQTIGPPGRKASEALVATQLWLVGLEQVKKGRARKIIVAHCRNNGSVRKFLERMSGGFYLREVDCASNLHAKEMEKLARSADQVAVVTCPPGGCIHREGLEHFYRRLAGDQQPAVWKGAREKISPISIGVGEESRLHAFLKGLEQGHNAPPSEGSLIIRMGRIFLRAIVSAALALLIAGGTRIGLGTDMTDSSALRLSWRVHGQVQEVCRDRTQQELDALPVHMRTPQVCQRFPVNYVLNVTLNGDPVLEKIYSPAGVKGDRPITIETDIPIQPGNHSVAVRFAPQLKEHSGLKSFEWRGDLSTRAGDIRMLTTDAQKEKLVLH